jgi:adenylosuccinate lyase
MESKSIFQNISPLDHRYYRANEELFTHLRRYLSEEAVIRYCTFVETCLLKTHIKFQFQGDKDLYEIVDKLPETVTPAEVYTEEEITHHNIRALVRVMKRYLPEKLRPYVHLGATSVDILDSAQSLRISHAVKRVFLPLCVEVEELLIQISSEHAQTIQVGRTHGQHAVPITFGFALTEYVARLGKSMDNCLRLSKNLRGKLSGAVGAYNAVSLVHKDPVELERYFLRMVGLQPTEYATQLVEPEYMLRLLLEINIIFGVIANLADDLRNLQRSEIAEIQELFTAQQVGSSTMPQKRNPWNSEHIKSLWKTFSPRVATFFMDQISEHQRDLTNSASSRFIPEFIAGAAAALNRTKKVLSTLHVFKEKMRANLSSSGDLVLAEPAYILLALGGENDAHEKIRQITSRCYKTSEPLLNALREDPQLWNTLSASLERLGMTPESFFSSPENYYGKSVEITQKICQKYKKTMQSIQEELAHEDPGSP